jgi:hypothetical protein
MVKEMLGEYYLELLAEQISQGYTIDFNGEVTITDADDITAVEFVAGSRQEIAITLASSGFYEEERLDRIDVYDGATNLGSLAEFADHNVMKAGWNWTLIDNDGSHGVHNPFFASDTLIASRDALLSVSGVTDRDDGIERQQRRQQLPPDRPTERRSTSWTSRAR